MKKNVKVKRLTVDQIEGSTEIRDWLNQFPVQKRAVATGLLLGLRFVTRDGYSEWLKATFLSLLSLKKVPWAVYTIRKFKQAETCLWDEAGNVLMRTSSSLGSEDLVNSVIANLAKLHGDNFLDHPSLAILKERRVRNVVLVDDSIGSGKRVVSFINRMMSHPTFLSWWSYGFIQLHIVAFARTIEAENFIVEKIPGSDHPKRKLPKSKKMNFIGPLAYSGARLENRWGINFQRIIDLCDSTKAIPPDRRRGFGNTMANLVFFHSIPNNIPGILWFDTEGWQPLFPFRSVPEWLPRMFDRAPTPKRRSTFEVSELLVSVLQKVRRGIRNETSLAHSLGIDPSFLKNLLATARSAGFLSEANRITEAGRQALQRATSKTKPVAFDRSLYVPTIWCVDQKSTQPSESGDSGRLVKTDSGRTSVRTDGEVGETSLERTDAKTALPSLTVMPQKPSEPRKSHDSHGPKGRKV